MYTHTHSHTASYQPALNVSAAVDTWFNVVYFTTRHWKHSTFC